MSSRTIAKRLDQVRLAGEILRIYVAVRWRLARTDLDRALDRARRPSAGTRTDAASLATLQRLGRGVERTLEPLPFDARCLTRSLVLVELLARRDINSTLVLAARTKPDFAAHSWVECQGTALLPTGSGFHRLTTL